MANNLLKNFSCLASIPVLLLGFFISPFIVYAQTADHLVISAVQITEGAGKTSHDFIEIYNPTDQDINLNGFRLVKRTKTGASDASIKSWTDDVYIQAHGWRLWASSEDKAYSLAIGADDATTATIAPDNGIAVRFGAADTGEIIDAVAWGAAENIFKESAAAIGPKNDAAEALVRKPGNGANGEDTNDNASDFTAEVGYMPHNSGGYAPVLPAETAESSTPAPKVSVSPDPQNSADNNIPLKPIIAEAGSGKEATIGQKVSFDGSDSYDPEEKVLSYNWDFGDGSKAGGANVSHSFSSVGDFRVVLKITSGSRSAEDFLSVKVVAPEFSDKINLSEILPDPVGSDKDGEWIEIYNGGDKKINLAGWMLDDRTDGGSKPYIFTEEASVDPKSFLVIPRSKSKIVLANAGGEVNLLWYNGKNISKVIYNAAKEGRSFAFIGDSWQWTDSPSLGKENILAKAEPAVQPKKAEPVLSSKTEEVAIETPAQTVDSADEERIIEEDYQASDEIFPEEEAVTEGVVPEDTEAAGTELKKPKASEPVNSQAVNNIKNSSRAEEKNNPWFLGDMALSVLSLFLVWRYQNLKKKVK